MVVAVVGRTDKRPVIYTLMHLFQKLGDCCVITHDQHFRRLIEDGIDVGHCQNIFIITTEDEPDQVFMDVGYKEDDFENIIFDCTDVIPDNADQVIFVAGSDGVTEDDETLLGMYEGYKVIEYGFGKKKIPYSTKAFEAIEIFEGLHDVRPIDQQITNRLASIFTEKLGLSVKQITEVVNRR